MTKASPSKSARQSSKRSPKKKPRNPDDAYEEVHTASPAEIESGTSQTRSKRNQKSLESSPIEHSPESESQEKSRKRKLSEDAEMIDDAVDENETEDVQPEDDSTELKAPKKKYRKRRKLSVFSQKYKDRLKLNAAKQREWREKRKQNPIEPSEKKVYKKRAVVEERKTDCGSLRLRSVARIDYNKANNPSLAALPRQKKTDKPKETGLASRKCQWNLRDKRLFEQALRSHHPDDIDGICQYLPHKKREEVEWYIDFLSKRPVESMAVPKFAAPVDHWTGLSEDMAREFTNHAQNLSLMMSVCAETVTNPEAVDGKVRPDYKSIYRYLADILDRKPPPPLGHYESAIVVDLLQILATTISTADITKQNEEMLRKFCLFYDMNKVKPHLTDRVRRGWSMAPIVEVSDPRAFQLPDPDWNSHIYKDSSFSWPEYLVQMVKMSWGRFKKDIGDKVDETTEIYQNQLQAFTFNPFGLTSEFLRLKRMKTEDVDDEIEYKVEVK